MFNWSTVSTVWALAATGAALYFGVPAAAPVIEKAPSAIYSAITEQDLKTIYNDGFKEGLVKANKTPVKIEKVCRKQQAYRLESPKVIVESPTKDGFFWALGGLTPDDL